MKSGSYIEPLLLIEWRNAQMIQTITAQTLCKEILYLRRYGGVDK